MLISNKSFQIRNKTISIPIVQGGMGVGISLNKLATAVINEGGIGTISAAQTGFRDEHFWDNYKASCEANYRAIKREISTVRENTKDGFLAVNILCASRDYANLAKTAVENKADAIISGAGLPIDLPKYTKGSDTANIPIVSSSRVLNIIMRKWQKKYDCIPDAVVIEGPKAGGHLGVKYEDINHDETIDTLMDRLVDVKAYMDKNELKFPIIVAGGVYTNEDINMYLNAGASAVQMGTRFIATEECDAHPNFKNKFINAQKEDVVYVKSPVGYPGRAIANNLTHEVSDHHIMPSKCIACVTPCKGVHESTPYCISERLSNAVNGDVENGLVFSGANGYRIDKITTVHNLINELLGRENE